MAGIMHVDLMVRVTTGIMKRVMNKPFSIPIDRDN